MAYRVTEITADEAWKYRTEYEYALVYMLSEVLLCKTSQLEDFDFGECTEARFFSSDKELHVFETEDGLSAVMVADSGEEDCVIRKYELSPRFSDIGKKLVVQEYLEYDEDGQVMVGLTRLKDLE